jgi:signal transduction histidine kinase
MTTAGMSLVVLKPHGGKLGFIFVAVSIVLAAIAFYGDPLFRVPIEDEDYERISFTVNFLVGLLSSVLILQFVMSRNDESESELKQKNTELQKTNMELDRFVYSPSHDMRAPLSTMLGLLNLARKTNEPAEIAIYHQMMFERIRTMDGFIKEIMDYSRN